MTDTVTAKLAEWAALTEGATPGPWHEEAGNVHRSDGSRLTTIRGTYVEAEPDAEFIAAAREMVPALLGLVEDVRAALAHEPCADTCGSRLNEVYPCSCWKSEIERALTERIGGA